MVGDDKVRYCTHCNQRVYNLTAMTRDEAERLIADRDGRMCLRYYRRPDGRIMTSDCPVGTKEVRNRRILISGSLLAFLINLAMAAQPEQVEQGNRVVTLPMESTLPPDVQARPTEDYVMGKP